MKYTKSIILVVLFECYKISVCQFFQPPKTMDIYLRDIKPGKPIFNVANRSNRNGCLNDNTQKITPTDPVYSLTPNYKPSFALPYPMIATTKKPLHISIPFIVDKPKKDSYPKKIPSNDFALKDDEDDNDDAEEDDDDEYEDYEEDDVTHENDKNNSETKAHNKDKFDPEDCRICLKAERKMRRRSDYIQTGKESKTDMELARDGFYKKYKKGSDTNGYSSKLHKDELFKDHIYYDS